MTRAAALSLAALFAALLAACSTEEPTACPGVQIGTFTFQGTMVAADDLGAGLDPDPALTDCATAMNFPPTVGFEGTLTSDASGSSGALCRPNRPILFGTRTGDRWVVVADSDGVVLSNSCAPSCVGRLQVTVAGDVVPDAVTPATFDGALVEQITLSSGACGACVLPCATRYELSGTVVPP